MDFEEFSHVVISVVTVSVAFAIAITGSLDVSREFASTFVEVLITVGAGFVLHELAHKYAAQRYGAIAIYRAWTAGLALAVVLAVAFGFVFAAPGAVYIYGRHLTREQNGKIAIAGPLANYALAIAFFLLLQGSPSAQGFLAYGAQVNLFLAFFNLLPFGPLDGAKVYHWNRAAWAAAIVPAFALLFLL